MVNHQTKHITICVDDFGINQKASDGVVELVKNNRISAVSCLVNSKYFSDCANQIKPFIDKIDIGLHFDLTKKINLGMLLLKSELHLINRTEIEIEFSNQLDSFISIVGKAPDFIDGHQHVHHLPVISDAIFNVYKNRLTSHRPYVRYVGYKKFLQLPTAKLKSLIIKVTADLQFESKLKRFEIPYNHTFAGIYNFKKSYQYHKLFPKFLTSIENNGLIMCHAGLLSSHCNDPIAKTRYDEWQYFMSNIFLRDCVKNKVNIGKFRKNC